jgi:hypothetical protein
MKREIPLGLSVYLDLVRFGAGMGELTERRTNW